MATRQRQTSQDRGLTRLLVADDEALVRLGIRCAVRGTHPDLVVDEAATPAELASAIADAEPDVVVLDAELAGRTSGETVSFVLERSPRTRALVLGRAGDLEDVRRAFAAGAAGYLAREDAAAILVTALRAVGNGDRYLDPRVGAELARAETNGGPATTLTAQEREVLELVASGVTSREIASRLGRPLRTIEGIRARGRRKLDLAGRSAPMESARVDAFRGR